MSIINIYLWLKIWMKNWEASFKKLAKALKINRNEFKQSLKPKPRNVLQIYQMKRNLSIVCKKWLKRLTNNIQD